MSRRESKSLWYQDGLEFTCTRCGACCTGAPGYVWVSPEEIDRLANFRGEPVEQFTAKFVRRVNGSYSLIEKPGGDCIFWDKHVGCTVYSARPDQCQTWPFWPENVETPEAWDHVCSVCPGSGKGRLYSVDEIISSLAKTPK